AALYTGDLSSEDRLAAYLSWINGENKIMICTCAFGAGNDYPHVRLIVHAGTPQDMVGYIQEISRAGRDKRHAKCYIIPNLSQIPTIPRKQDLTGKHACWEMIFGVQLCLRYSITLFNDGKGIACGDDDCNEECSRC
ncbi:P-loop containing nucleoside triphosphate hydrolase protein, partial [Crepidotus variabilis]